MESPRKTSNWASRLKTSPMSAREKGEGTHYSTDNGEINRDMYNGNKQDTMHSGFGNYYSNPRIDDSENQYIGTSHKKSDNTMYRERQWGGNDDNNTCELLHHLVLIHLVIHEPIVSSKQSKCPQVGNSGWGNMNYSSSNETLIPTDFRLRFMECQMGLISFPIPAQSMPNVMMKECWIYLQGDLQNAVFKVQVEGIHYIAVVLVMVTPCTTQHNTDQMKQCGKMVFKKIYEQTYQCILNAPNE